MSKCPSCNSDGAYVGLSIIECPTAGCKNYSLKQAAIVRLDDNVPIILSSDYVIGVDYYVGKYSEEHLNMMASDCP